MKKKSTRTIPIVEKIVYIVHFYCCRLDPKSIYGVYSTQKKAKEATNEINGWIETFTVNKGKKVYGTKKPR